MADLTAPPELPYRGKGTAPTVTFATFIVITIVTAVLFIGRGIFVPLAVAALFSFALGPPTLWLRRYVGRATAVIGVVTLAFLVILAFGAIIAGQITSLAENLPSYQTNLQAKVRSIQSVGFGGLFERAAHVLRDLQEQVEKPPEPQKTVPFGAAFTPAEPIPVVVRQPEPAPIQVIQNVIGPLLEPLIATGIIVVVVIFMLLRREDLRDRLIRLVGAHDLQRTTEALDDAAHRVSRYLLSQLVVNVAFGLPIALGLWLIGVPNAILWGLLAAALRFIPYVGVWIAALFPFALSIAVDPGWNLLFWTVGLFIVVDLVTAYVVEPLVFGHMTGLSSIAVIVAAVFWTWLWGPVGLLLSTPLTVCLVVLGRHVPHLEFLDVLFGNEPVLTPAQRFYQRMLAGDPDEATEQAEKFVGEHSVGEFYDEVVIGGLELAQSDRDRGVLDVERIQTIVESAHAVLENLKDSEPAAVEIPDEPGTTPAALGESRSAPDILCIAGRHAFDRIATDYLADLLRRESMQADILQGDAGTSMRVRNGAGGSVRIVCLSQMDTVAVTPARYMIRRIRRRLPGTMVLAGFLTVGRGPRADLAQASGADLAASSLREAVEAIRASLKDTQAEIPGEPAEIAPALGLQPTG